MDKKLIDKISKRKGEGTIRSLSCLNSGIDFYSNDYLGFSKFQLKEKITNAYGSTGSRLISGTSESAIHCEKTLAEFFKSESALVFNSGYDANLGLFSAVPQRGDTIVYDENIHASSRDGIRLSLANSFSFKHNSIADLKLKLQHSKGAIYIAVESIYSMDGDLAPLNEIAKISKEFKAYLIVDEAHACGVFGDKGRGIVDDLGIKNEIFARVITFGKAYGAHGACVLGEKDLIEFLINFARSFIYTTALPPMAYQRIIDVISINSDNERSKLMENISFFRKCLVSDKLISDLHSPIQMLRIGDIDQTKKIAEILQENGFAIKPIYSPTVKNGEEGIRICIHSFNSKTEILKICELMHPNSSNCRLVTEY